MNAEDLPGAIKARGVLGRMENTAPKRTGSAGLIKRQYIEALYAEIRAVRLKGWGWVPIQKELSGVDGLPRMSVDYISQTFAEVDKEWEKKTGVKALPVKSGKGRRKA